jgi:ribonucleoside-diphosphate reductase beta chain
MKPIKSQLFHHNPAFKPIKFEEALNFYGKQLSMFWRPTEVSLAQDIMDFKHNITDDERKFLIHIFKFFTSADVNVAQAYLDTYIPLFKNTEVRMMLVQFAATEALHIEAYSHLLDHLGFTESDYNAFMDIPVMRKKHEYTKSGLYKDHNLNKIESALVDIAVFSMYTEGLHLFSSFAMLLNFGHRSLMKGMADIVRWSLRDEDLHVQGMTWLMGQLIQAYPDSWNERTKNTIIQVGQEMLKLEFGFIDHVYGNYKIEGLTSDEVKSYAEYILDTRYESVGLPLCYNYKDHPLPWVDMMLSANEHGNFFEVAVTEYTKGESTGSHNIFTNGPLGVNDILGMGFTSEEK